MRSSYGRRQLLLAARGAALEQRSGGAIERLADRWARQPRGDDVVAVDLQAAVADVLEPAARRLGVAAGARDGHGLGRLAPEPLPQVDIGPRGRRLDRRR